MALYYGLVPTERQSRVLAFMRERFPAEEPDPYTYFFFLETLYRRDTEEMDRAAIRTIRDRWGQMTAYETGTTSEFWNRGSYVHEAGAHPAYFLSSYVLGPRTEGLREARRLIIDPRLGNLDHAAGTTLTEFGPVSVRWRREGEHALVFEVENATTAPALVSLRLPGMQALLTVDDQLWLRSGVPGTRGVSVQDGRVRFPLRPGKHSGRLDATGKR
jgi:hypothetical protein